tara:strand:+ start:1118 stop:1240 length:123 start_codon:yes stop_codon:yes gene_type:complete
MSAGRTAVLSDTKDHIQIKNLPPAKGSSTFTNREDPNLKK